MSTPSVLLPVLEQAAPADVEMAAAEPEVRDVLGEMELMFGKKRRKKREEEKIKYQELKKQWDEQEQQTKIVEYNTKVKEKQNEANRKKEEAACLAFADIVGSDQEKVSDDDLAEQRTMLLAHKAAREMTVQVEIEYEQAQTEKLQEEARQRGCTKLAEPLRRTWSSSRKIR